MAGAKAWMLWSGFCVLLAGGLGATIAWWTTTAGQAPRMVPAVAVPPKTLDPASARSATEAQDLVRLFKQRHPVWRLTDYGRRLGDPQIWRSEGEWRFSGDGTVATTQMANPGKNIARTRLSLVPTLTAGPASRLFVAWVQVPMRTLRTGIGLGLRWKPAVHNWERSHRFLSLSENLVQRFPQEESAPPAQDWPDGFQVAVMADREGVLYLMEEQRVAAPPEVGRVIQGKELSVEFELLCRLCPETKSCVLSSVEVYEAGGGP